MADVDGSNLRVPPELEMAGSTMQGTAGTIDQQLNDLKAKLMPLEDWWTGPAQTYYYALRAEWNVAAEGLFGQNGVLGEIASAMNLGWNNYSDCEWANVRTWRIAGST